MSTLDVESRTLFKVCCILFIVKTVSSCSLMDILVCFHFFVSLLLLNPVTDLEIYNFISRSAEYYGDAFFG